MYAKLGIDPERMQELHEVPAVPVRMFKSFDLSTVDRSEVTRVLRSSGTTAQHASVVPLNKATASNQTRALRSILGAYLGDKRRLMLVIDHPGVNNPSRELTARGAGVRGLSIYAKDIVYLLREEDGRLVLVQAVERRAACRGQEVYVFGFTFIMVGVLQEMEERQLKLDLPRAVVFHGGGWKKLRTRRSAGGVLPAPGRPAGLPPEEIRDFYGMRADGSLFVDCELGHKHVPVFGHVIIRDVRTMENRVGERGLIEVMSVLGEL